MASVAAFFVNPNWAVDQATKFAQDFVPRGAGQVANIVKGAINARQTVGILSLIGLLWAGSRVFGAATKALNIAYDVNDTYSFWKRIALEVVMTLTLGALFFVALAVQPMLRLLIQIFDFLPGSQSLLYRLAINILPILLLILALFLTYLYLPRRRVDWRAALLGTVVATGLLLAARPLFLTYLNKFANYNLIYGSLAIVVSLVFWAWIVAAIILLGGEFVSHSQFILVEQIPPHQVKARHIERSPTLE